MTAISVGDLAQTILLRRHNAELKADVRRFSTEMTTGRTADVTSRVQGDFAPLAGIDASLARLRGYGSVTAQLALETSAMQNVIGSVQQGVEALAPSLLLAGTDASGQGVAAASREARQRLDGAIGALNTRLGDQALFAGTAGDRSPLISAEALLTALDARIAGATGAADIEARVTAWFSDPGGFATVAYQGGGARPAVAVAPGDMAQVAVTAADPALRDTLKGLAMAALLDRGALAGQPDARRDLARRAGEGLASSQGALATLAGHLGTTEARINEARTRNSAETSALEIARNGIVAVDPYETATRLEAAQTQLETLYSLTARVSRLSLVDFLR